MEESGHKGQFRKFVSRLEDHIIALKDRGWKDVE
jgi:hypothetical protein